MFDRSVQEIQAEQKAFEELLGTLGRDLISVLNATIKVAAMYEPNNNRYIEQSSRLRGLLGKIFEEETDFTLVAKGGYFYISDVRIKVDKESDAAMDYFLETWPILGISGFSFSKGMDATELDKFIYLVKSMEPGENHAENFQLLKTRFNELGIETISPIMYVLEDDNPDDDPEKDKIRARARRTFFSALTVVQSNVNQARNQGNINVAKTKRVVQGLIDIIIEDEAAMMEMTALRNFDDYTYVHSVNVCVLSLVLGYHLGLDRRRLSNMGVGALLHDIGKTSLPVDLVNKPEDFDEYDWNLMRKHPVFGLKFIFKTRRVDETTVRASTVVYEHHIGYDGSGYPELLSKRKPSLYARIVAIADSFNAMTSGRVYHRKKFLPDEAITSMINRIGNAYDPLLLKVFINSVGVYPVGTVVALDSKEIGIVSRNNPDNPERPQVKIIGNEAGMYETDEVKVIDLSRDAGKSITRMIDGEKYNIDNAEYLDIG